MSQQRSAWVLNFCQHDISLDILQTPHLRSSTLTAPRMGILGVFLHSTLRSTF